MKKLFLLPLIACSFTANSFALEFFAGQKDEGEKNHVFSTAQWTHTKDFVEPFTKTKPSGSNDYVGVRFGGYKLTIDKDIKISGFYVGANSDLIIDGRKVDLKRSVDIRTPSQSQNSRLILKPGSTLNVGSSINFGLYQYMKNSGDSTVIVEDSNLIIKNNLNYIPESGVAVNKKQAVWGVELTGKSYLEVKGNILIDPIFKDVPNEWLVKYTFTEKNGAIPRMVIAKDANLSSCAVAFNVKNSKPGKFVLIECISKKDGVKNLRYVSINGKRCAINETVPFGKNSTATLFIEPAGKDAKTANDLVVEIK